MFKYADLIHMAANTLQKDPANAYWQLAGKKYSALPILGKQQNRLLGFLKEEKPRSFKGHLMLFLIRNYGYVRTPEAEKLPELKGRMAEMAKLHPQFDAYPRDKQNCIKREIINPALEEIRLAGRALYLIEKGAVKALHDGYFQSGENQALWISMLSAWLGKDLRDLTKNDLRKNGLEAILHYCGYSPFKAVSSACPGLKASEMRHRQQCQFRKIGEESNNRKARREAIEKLAHKPQKDPLRWTSSEKRAWERAEKFIKSMLSGQGMQNRDGNGHEDLISSFVAESLLGDGDIWNLDRARWKMAQEHIKGMLGGNWRAYERVRPRHFTEFSFKYMEKNGMSALLDCHGGLVFEAVRERYPDTRQEDMEYKPKPCAHGSGAKPLRLQMAELAIKNGFCRLSPGAWRKLDQYAHFSLSTKYVLAENKEEKGEIVGEIVRQMASDGFWSAINSLLQDGTLYIAIPKGHFLDATMRSRLYRKLLESSRRRPNWQDFKMNHLGNMAQFYGIKSPDAGKPG